MRQRIPLPEACSKLQMTREQVIPRIQKGELEGGQAMGGRWFVTLESIERYLAKEAAAEAADSEGAA